MKTSLGSGQLVSTSQMIFGPKNQVKTISIWLLWFWKGKLLGGGFFLCLIEKKRMDHKNIFSPPDENRQPFLTKKFSPWLCILFQKSKFFVQIWKRNYLFNNLYCRKHQVLSYFLQNLEKTRAKACFPLHLCKKIMFYSLSF